MKWRLVTATAGGVVMALLTVSPSWAAPTTHVVQGEVLRLVSIADWDAASNLLPEQAVQWDVTVSADAPDPGVVRIGIDAQGTIPLTVDAAFCMQEWESNECPDGATVLHHNWDLPRDGVELPLTQVTDTDTVHLRLTIGLGDAPHDGSTEVRVYAHGAGESIAVGPGGGLATTGMSATVPWILGGGAVLVFLGFMLIALRRHRGTRSDSEGES